MLVENTFATTATPEGIQAYQKSEQSPYERKQSVAADIYRYNNADNIWDTLRQEFTLPHYEDNPKVQEQIDWIMNNQDFLYRSASRAAPYLYYILQQVHKRRLPAEVALLPIFESSFNPFASSPVGAAGIWQMMPDTASGYGIKQNWWYDGRRDVVISTQAALNYLAYLGNFFDGNWLYAIAAYDTGEGNLLSAIKKNIRYGESTDFWNLPVAQETKDYIPKLLALATVISHPERYPVELPYVRNAPYLAQVDIGTQIDLKHAATLAGLSFKELKQFNPGYNRGTTDPNGPYKLTLPIENVVRFTENLEMSPQYKDSSWMRYKVKSGETLTSIAKKFDTSPSQLKKFNTIFSRKKLKPGASIAVPQSSDTDDGQYAANTPSKTVTKINTRLKQNYNGRYTLQPGDTLYMVRNGDDLNKVARRFHITTDMLKQANNISASKRLPVGEQLIIPTHTETADETGPRPQLTPGDTLYMVRKGDTIEKIAKKYHITPSTLRLNNLMASNDVKEGDQIIIPTHA